MTEADIELILYRALATDLGQLPAVQRQNRALPPTLNKGTIYALTSDGAHATIAARIDHYNNHRLHSAIGYVTPRDKLLGRETEIWTKRDRKLEQARELRRKRRELDHLGAAA